MTGSNPTPSVSPDDLNWCFRQFFERATEGGLACVADTGRLLDVSPSFLTLSGHDRASLEAHDCNALFGTADGGAIRSLLRPDGSALPVRVTTLSESPRLQ